MIEIKDLLKKFDHILFSEELKINVIQKVLKEVIGLEVKNTDIKINNNTIYLEIKPIYKNEIFLNRERIQSLLENALGKKTPKNIR